MKFTPGIASHSASVGEKHVARGSEQQHAVGASTSESCCHMIEMCARLC